MNLDEFKKVMQEQREQERKDNAEKIKVIAKATVKK
jgi:hypothetical protein